MRNLRLLFLDTQEKEICCIQYFRMIFRKRSNRKKIPCALHKIQILMRGKSFTMQCETSPLNKGCKKRTYVLQCAKGAVANFATAPFFYAGKVNPASREFLRLEMCLRFSLCAVRIFDKIIRRA